MAAVCCAVLLLLLGLASTGPPPNCDDVNKPVRLDQLDKVLGSWVLVGSVSDEKVGLLPKLSSSFMELSLSEDNSSFIYTERNKFRDESCVWYYIAGNITESSNLTVILHTVVREEGGVVTSSKGSFGHISLYQTWGAGPHPEDHITSYYNGVFDPSQPGSAHVQFTLLYRREGKHQDLESLKDVPLTTKLHAECLQMTELTGQFTYDGVSENCPKKVLLVKAEEETEA